MFNPLDSAQKADLIALIQQHGLEEVEAKILEKAQNCMALVPSTEEDKSAIGKTRLGGLPDVPVDWEWPEHMEFLGQINLEESAFHDHNELLPKQGLLSFFFASERWGDWASGLPHRVFHFDSSNGPLKLASAPRGYLPYKLSHGSDCVYTPVCKKLTKSITLPAGYSRDSWQISGDQFYDAYWQMVSGLGTRMSGMSSHRLLGHHQFMDGDADEDAWEQTNNISIRLRGVPVSEEERRTTLESFDKNIQQESDKARTSTDPSTAKAYSGMAEYFRKKREDYLAYLERKEEIDAELEEWILLLQVDTDDESGMQFNDAGFAYFMIRKADLAAARFDRTYAALWSC